VVDTWHYRRLNCTTVRFGTDGLQCPTTAHFDRVLSLRNLAGLEGATLCLIARSTLLLSAFEVAPRPAKNIIWCQRNGLLILVEKFNAERFFTIPRTDPSRMVSDVPAIRLAYRDERRIHEVVDDDRRSARITDLENRFKVLTEVDRYQKPSVSLYLSLLNAGWDINTLGADQQNALTSAVLHRDLQSARFLVQRGSRVTRQTLTYATLGNNLGILRLIVESSDGELPRDIKAAPLIQAARSGNVDLVKYE
jgi:hypothetical protein